MRVSSFVASVDLGVDGLGLLSALSEPLSDLFVGSITAASVSEEVGAGVDAEDAHPVMNSPDRTDRRPSVVIDVRMLLIDFIDLDFKIF